MFVRCGLFLAFLSLPAPSVGAGLLCEGAPVTVLGGDAAVAERVCRVATRAVPGLAQCGLPVTRMVTIRVVEDGLGDGCVGLYHCGADLIEVLAPARLEAQRGQDGLFGAVPTDRFFDSIVVHELAHAAHDALPCPAGICLATSEYLAYNSQIMALSAEDRSVLMASIDMERTVSHDELNASILFFKPDAFAARAWAHLNQREDPCTYLRHVAEGDFTFDRERP